MKLYINCVTSELHFAIFSSNTIIFEKKHESRNHLVEAFLIFSEIKEKFDLSKLSQVIVINGPGGFSGIRIGAIIAQRVASYYQVSVICLNLLEVLYQSGMSPAYVKFSKTKYWKYDGNEITIFETTQDLSQSISLSVLINLASKTQPVEPDQIKVTYNKEV